MGLQLWDDFEDEFTLFGIASKSWDEVKFIYNLNAKFKLRFKRNQNLDVYWDDELFCFSLYSHEDDEALNEFHIIKNLSHPISKEMNEDSLFSSLESERYLLPKLKHFDYLLKIPYHLEKDELNPLPLNNALFVKEYSLITNLSNKEKKLFSI